MNLEASPSRAARATYSAATVFPTPSRALALLLAAVGLVTVVILALAPLLFHPEEDAVILFGFSRNLAHTGQITFIPHGPRAEGATDFAWMLAIAAGIRAGIAPFPIASVLSALALLFMAAVLLRLAHHSIRPFPVLCLAGCFGLCPQIVAAVAGFSVLPFACLLTFASLCFLRRRDLALALSCLALSLLRPDGIVFALPLLFGATVVYPGRARRAVLFLVAYGLPGAAYFLWRWHYFGLLLPLPFLVKSDTHRVLHLFVTDSVETGLLLCFFAALLCWFALRPRGRPDRPTTALILCLLVLPNFFYFALRLDQNVGHRFFLYLPVGAAVIIASRWNRIGDRRPWLLPVAACLWLIFVSGIFLNEVQDFWADQFDSRERIGTALGRLPPGVLVTTEAGIVPYFSGWTSYDAWGLSTPQFAQRLFQPSDVASLQPDAILLHAEDKECEPGADWRTPYASRTWAHLTRNLIAGATAAHFQLWYTPLENSRYRAHNQLNSWQSDQDCWYLRPDSPHYGQLVAILQGSASLPAADYHARLAAPAEPDAMPPATPPTSSGTTSTGPTSLTHKLSYHLRKLPEVWTQLTRATD